MRGGPTKGTPKTAIFTILAFQFVREPTGTAFKDFLPETKTRRKKKRTRRGREVGCHGRPCPPAPLRAAGRSPGGAARGAAAGYLCVEWASVSRAAGGGRGGAARGKGVRTGDRPTIRWPGVEVPWVFSPPLQTQRPPPLP